MLDSYKDRQPVAYNIMMNEVLSGHLSHAYLIDENNNSDAFDLVLSFVKKILCSFCKSEDEKIKLIKRIDGENYPEIKIIRPDGMLIKKSQIIDLQKEFSMSAVEGSKRIYIICDADKMRPETANSMLKFLEEPNDDIIAILITNNYNNLLSTIVSRCQVIRLVNNENKDTIEEFDTLANNFILAIENSGFRTMINIQELLFNSISPKDRNKLELFFDKVIDKYYLAINDTENSDLQNIIVNKNTKKRILNKIDCLIKAKDSIKYNVNNSLLIDSVIVSLGGKDEDSWS